MISRAGLRTEEAPPRLDIADPVRVEKAALVVAAGAVVLTLALAYVGKIVCLQGETGFWAATRYCYSDVNVLWSLRGLDAGALPYAPPPPGYSYAWEYPPGITLPAWLIAIATPSHAAYFNLHALTFVAAALVALWELRVVLRALARSPWRLLGLSLSPGLVLFGMQNWDLWPVALAAAGLGAAARGRTTRAAVWFGLGAATKWWPALLLVVLMAGPWSGRDRDGDERLLLAPASTRRPSSGALSRLLSGEVAGRVRPLVIAGVAWALVQLPAILIGPSAWAGAITFHLRRPPNPDSTPAAVAALGNWLLPGSFWGVPYARLYTVVSLLVLAGGMALVARRLRLGALDPGNAALALVGLYLLTGKVFSPQFIVWLLPVAVAASVPWTPVLAVEACNAAVWLLYGPWMGRMQDPVFTGFLRTAEGMSVVRTLTVAWLVVAALLARQERPHQDQTQTAHERQQT